MAHQMDDAGLDCRFREGRGDGIRKALEAVYYPAVFACKPRGHDRDKDVLNSVVLQLRHHGQPEFGTLVVGNPQAQNLAHTVPVDAEGNIDGLVLDHAAVRVADLDPQSIKNDDRIHPIQRPGLPFPDLVQHRVCHTADQIWRHLQAVNFFEMGADIADRQTCCVETDDLVIHPIDPGLSLLCLLYTSDAADDL